MKQYLLIFNRVLNEDQKTKIKTVSGASTLSVPSNSQRNISDLLEILSHCDYGIDEHSSFVLMMEIEKPPIMVMMLNELAPVIILEIKDGFDETMRYVNRALNKYHDHQCYIAELSTGSSDYKRAYNEAFGEQSTFDDAALVRDIEERIEDEREMLIEKMRSAVEIYKIKSE